MYEFTRDIIGLTTSMILGYITALIFAAILYDTTKLKTLDFFLQSMLIGFILVISITTIR